MSSLLKQKSLNKKLKPETSVGTTIKEVGKFLEQQAKIGEAITYGKIIERFPDLPPLNGAWESHPLCLIFGDLDIEDQEYGRPFRTALVFNALTGRPGAGFFKMIGKLRNKTILDREKDGIWMAELNALKIYTAQSQAD